MFANGFIDPHLTNRYAKMAIAKFLVVIREWSFKLSISV